MTGFWGRPRKTESARLQRAQRRRARARKGLSLLPSALTLCNLVCGFGAIIKVATIQYEANGTLQASGESSLFYAGVLMLLAMVFDALDGRVARLTKSTSDFGGELDSLCDAITFGVTPGIIVVMLNSLTRFPSHTIWGKAAWVFGVAYACGAILRLARFNVENTHDESAHQSFKGLPTPAAAGVIASLVLFRCFLKSPRGEYLPFLSADARGVLGDGIITILPVVALALGYLMISRYRYVHVVNVYLRGRTHFDNLNTILLVGAISALLIAIYPELLAVLVFGGFAISGPAVSLLRMRQGPGHIPEAIEVNHSSENPPAKEPELAENEENIEDHDDEGEDEGDDEHDDDGDGDGDKTGADEPEERTQSAA